MRGDGVLERDLGGADVQSSVSPYDEPAGRGVDA
jgi:hypothetical protein